MKSIRLKSLEILNYRQFVNQKIDLTTSAERNIIVIIGKNGFGKSNIFNAVNWCFYGVEEHLSPDDKSLPIINTRVFQKLKKGSFGETYVKIEMDTASGQKVIERHVRTEKVDDGVVRTEQLKPKVIECIGGDWKISPYPDFTISRILPEDMKNYFFIDGEKLRQLFEKANPKVIKKSIFDLSQITLLQDTIDHLASVKRAIRSSKGHQEPLLDNYETTLKTFSDKIKANKGQADKKEDEIKTAQKHKSKLSDQLHKIKYENLSRLEEERIRLEESLKSLESDLKRSNKDYFDYLFSVAPIILCHEAITTTLHLVKELGKADKLPPRIEAPFIEELLQKGECICGTDISGDKNSDKRKKLEQILNDNKKYSNLSENVINLKYSLINAEKLGHEYESRTNGYEIILKDIEGKSNDSQVRLKEVRTKLGEINIEQIKKLNDERELLEQAIMQAVAEVGQLRTIIRDDEEAYAKIEADYMREMKKKRAFAEVVKKVELCDQGIDGLTKIKDKIMDKIRDEIQKSTKKYFDNLISAKNFGKFEITPEYDLIIEQDGFNAITSLSAAETLCMGYSFMAALRKSSEFAAPIIIDTPLAKIDREYRTNVAEWFKKSLQDAQVILLVTDTEYTDEFRKAIKANISREYLISFDEATKSAEVNNNV